MRNEKKKSRKSKKSGFLKGLFLVIPLILILAGGAFFLWWSGNLKPAAETAESQSFVIDSGMSAGQVAEKLESQQLIRSAKVFQYYCRANQADSQLKAGVYYLSADQTPQEIIAILLQGPEPDVVVVTLPEGYTVQQIVTVLAQKGLGAEEEFYQAMAEFDTAAYSFLADLPEVEYPWEGYLFPATYYFDTKAAPEVTLSRFLDRFAQELDEKTKQRLAEADMSVSEWVTKASIVEREAVKSEERAIIAGVFENRLKVGMLLQSCATVQYLLDEVKPVLSYDDIAIESPYNTYKYTGLPPGPIANPGHASLQAALYPETTEYLYFVAKADGSHAFAKTNAEHLSNIAKYQ